MAAYYLEMQPHLFQDAVQTAFSRIKEQREAEAAAAQAQEEADKKVGCLPLRVYIMHYE